MATFFSPTALNIPYGPEYAEYTLHGFLAGPTTTATNLYVDSSGTIAGQVITLDDEGYLSTSGTRHALWLDDAVAYYLEMRDTAGNVVWSENNVSIHAVDPFYRFVADTGAANAYVMTLSPPITAYSEGTAYITKILTTNTTASTLNINSLGAFPIHYTGAVLTGGELIAGDFAVFFWNATNSTFQLAATQRFIVGDAELKVLAGLTFLDEDDMVSDSATALASQQSIKAYVDNLIAAATIPDGDKGDIIVSASGATWTLDTGVVTATAKTLLDDTSIGAMQITLGLVIGTNVQAYNANLTTWQGKTAPSGTVVGTSDSQTLTNKTISGSGNTLSSIPNSALTGAPSGTIVGTTDSQTLTNKTMSGASNTFSNIPQASVTGAPSGAVVGTTDTQTLTNKTISGASNTLSNVNLASQVTGTLPATNGGTGVTALSSLQLGNFAVSVSTSGPSGGADGDFWFVREA
jgi:hypothetical protein